MRKLVALAVSLVPATCADPGASELSAHADGADARVDAGPSAAPPAAPSTAPTADAGEHDAHASSGEGGTSGGPPRGKDELLWIDDDITFQSAPYPPIPTKSPPANWFAPVDYYDGKIEVRLEVSTKADATPVWMELCMWQGMLGAPTHTCLHCIEPAFTSTGTYTCEMSPSDGLNAASVDFHEPFIAMQHRAKDGAAGRGADLATEGKGLPMVTHYTIVLVPKGQTFSGWAAYAH